MFEVTMEASWKLVLADEFEKPYFKELTSFVKSEYEVGVVFPELENIFRAFDFCPFDTLKVVVLGQDPYHGMGQANGLSFAVNEGVTLPPSLKNIFKEIESDLGYKPIPSGDLARWAKQGVLLLNAVLTVRKSEPASHKAKGWEMFTDAVIRVLNERKVKVVYMLWGKYAQGKGQVIDTSKNLVLQSGHPSPFSAHLFHGNHHFSLCNEYLTAQGLKEIGWR
jgi:uracil-DNA glycosylase